MLCQTEAAGLIPKKLDPTWEGPFRVVKVACPRA